MTMSNKNFHTGVNKILWCMLHMMQVEEVVIADLKYMRCAALHVLQVIPVNPQGNRLMIQRK